MLRQNAIALLLVSMILTGCDKKITHERDRLETEQFARVQILNAFSATDSAIQAVAFNSQVIDSISDERGASSGGGNLSQKRGWSIHLKTGIDSTQRAELLSFLHSLQRAYSDLNSMKYGDVSDFNFSYDVIDQGSRIDVKATGSFGKK